MKENAFLAWIRGQIPTHPKVELSIGDDMAAVRIPAAGTPAGLALLKIDQCLDQVHFDLRTHTATQAGRKAVNRCLSDCAGMASLPAAIMLSVALPRDLPVRPGEEGPQELEAFAKELFLACRDAAAVFDCAMVGGDTAIWDQRLAITVAALGTMPAGQSYITRSGARPGDTLFVSGELGGSILGRHLAFTPRIALAQALAKTLQTPKGNALHALMDLSDGLAQDLPRLCAASKVGAEIHINQLPVHPDAEKLAASDHLPAAFHALADGEDYELLFAIDPEATPEVVHVAQTNGIPLTAIGVVAVKPDLVLIDITGSRHPWPRAGWEHRTA